MKDTTLNILEAAAWEILRRDAQCDPALRELHARQTQLHREFVCGHKSNPALRRQVLRLLDAQSATDCTEKERLFRLGLQMGLQLGGLDAIAQEQ